MRMIGKAVAWLICVSWCLWFMFHMFASMFGIAFEGDFHGPKHASFCWYILYGLLLPVAFSGFDFVRRGRASITKPFSELVLIPLMWIFAYSQVEGTPVPDLITADWWKHWALHSWQAPLLIFLYIGVPLIRAEMLRRRNRPARGGAVQRYRPEPLQASPRGGWVQPRQGGQLEHQHGGGYLQRGQGRDVQAYPLHGGNEGLPPQARMIQQFIDMTKAQALVDGRTRGRRMRQFIWHERDENGEYFMSRGEYEGGEE